MTDVNPSVGTPGSPGFYTQFAEPVETFVDEAGGNGEKLARKLQVSDRGLWVSPNGSDSNDGLSGGTAKLTPQAALDAVGLAGGGTVTLLGDTYQIDAGLTGSTSDLRLTAVHGAVIQASGIFPTDQDLFVSSAATNQEISGITFDGNGRARWGIRHSSGVNCLVEKNHIFGCQVGIRHGSGTNNTIQGNHCYSNTGQGIVEIGATGQLALHNKILDNHCYDNGTDTVGNLGWGINVSEHSRYFIVSGNHCYDNFQGGIVADLLHTGSPLVLQDADGVISNNVCTGISGSNGSHAISWQGGISGSIMGNICTGVPKRGLFLNGRGVSFGGNVFGTNTLGDVLMQAANPTVFTPTAGGFYTILPNNHLGGSGINGVIQGVGGEGTHIIADESKLLTVTDAAAPFINAANGSIWSLTILANANRTLANPSNLIQGKVYTLRIANGTGGAYSATFGFNTVWRADPASAVPANGKVRSAQFIYDGTNLTQITPWTVDI